MSDEAFPYSGIALQNWLRTSGQNIFTEFETGAAGLEYLRSIGGSIRDSTFYEIRRQVLGLEKYQENLGNVDDNNLIPMAWTVSDHGLDLSQNFLYRVEVTGTDPTDGTPVTKYFAISSDKQLTPGQVTDALGAMIGGESVFYEIEAEDYTVTSALVRPDFNQ